MRITLDNGPELTSKALQSWALEADINLAYIEPSKPMQNEYIESFNGNFCDECLNAHLFRSLKDSQWVIEFWRKDDNQVRPYSSLDHQTPYECALTFACSSGTKTAA